MNTRLTERKEKGDSLGQESQGEEGVLDLKVTMWFLKAPTP